MTNISQKLLIKMDILVPFTRGYAKKWHASGLARLLCLPQKTVARELEHLGKNKLLEFERVGKNKYYFFDWSKASSYSLTRMVESYKELKFLVEQPKISLLLNELALKYSLILFGSYAKNKAKKDSDLDLVVLGKKSKEVESIIRRYPFETSLHFLTLVQFKKMLKKDEPFAEEVVKDHILFGEQEKIIKLLVNHSIK